MAVLSTNNLTLLDWAKRTDKQGNIPVIAELLSQTNEILDDCVFVMANDVTSHRVVIRTGLPSVYWRSINEGIPPSKSTTAQVDESIGMLEAYSEPDVELVKLNGNTEETRLSEDVAFLEAMNQEMASTIFYGNPASDPNKPLGLAPRYSQHTNAGNSQNVLSAGGAGSDNTSIWLLVWGEQSVFCTFPKGSTAGLEHHDMGEQLIQKSDGTRYKALVTHYIWKLGLVVKDWRYAVRICNVDVSDLIAQTGTQLSTASTAIIKLMSRALDRIPNLNMGKACFYMNRTCFSGLKLAAMDKSSSALGIEQAKDQFGTSRAWLSYEGVPIRKTDALLNTESVVPA